MRKALATTLASLSILGYVTMPIQSISLNKETSTQLNYWKQDIKYLATTKTVSTTKYKNSQEELQALIIPRISYTTLKQGLTIGGKYYQKGTKFEVYEDRSYKQYLLVTSNGKYWVSAKYLTPMYFNISQKPAQLSDEQIVAIVNMMNPNTSTGKYVWVDLARQEVYALSKRGNGDFVLERRMQTATGKANSPTIRGTFNLTSNRGKFVKLPQYNESVKYWMSIRGGYWFHSVPLSYDGSRVVEPKLGEPASHGCVRLDLKDAEWFYYWLPTNTPIWIN